MRVGSFLSIVFRRAPCRCFDRLCYEARLGRIDRHSLRQDTMLIRKVNGLYVALRGKGKDSILHSY